MRNNSQKGKMETWNSHFLTNMIIAYGSEYLLDGYITLGNPIPIRWEDEDCTLQLYQGEHNYEYVIANPEGKKSLFYNGVLKRVWTETERGFHGDFCEYECGKVKFMGNMDNLLEGREIYQRSNGKNGSFLIIYDRGTNKITYRGQYNKNMKRHGLGIRFDPNSGKEVLEGVWNNGELCKVLKIFDKDVMTEFADKGDTTQCISRVPVYIGGYCYDESVGTFVRNGIGCLIDENTRIAYREGEWEKGVEISGTNLANGWYESSPLVCSMKDENDVNGIVATISDVIIEPNCLNNVSTLDWSCYDFLKSITIGDNSMMNVEGLSFTNLNSLRTITVGEHCCNTNNGDFSDEAGVPYCFLVQNCCCLKSIKIGAYSFVNWKNGIDLKQLPELETLQIGELEKESWNFCRASLEIRGRLF